MPRSGSRARHSLSVLSILALFITTFSPISVSPATAAPALITCVNLQTGTERISHTGKCRYSQEAQANWYKNQSDSPIASGPTAKAIVVCSNKESSPVSYQVIRKKCARHQVTTIFSRSGSLPAKPLIAEAVSFGHDSASLKLAIDPATSADAPIAFYTITSTTVETRTAVIVQSQRVYYWKDLNLAINTLQASTRYTFTVSATTADGTSAISALSNQVTTPAYVAPESTASAAPLAAPAFTLSVDAETKTAGTSISGYSIIPTLGGGAVASYSISPAAPAGTTFSNSSGLLTGSPTSSQSATVYTITATNASGSATRTFTLTVTAVVYTVGQTGPGGGRIYYYSAVGFTCGPTFLSNCNYLEVAPSNWSGGVDPSMYWEPNETSFKTSNIATIPNETTLNNSAGAIGLGYKYTLAIVGQSSDTTTAAVAARAFAPVISGATISDWYLPTSAELNLMCQWQRGITQDVSTPCSGGTLNSGSGASGFAAFPYWTSSEYNPDCSWAQDFGTGGQAIQNTWKNNVAKVRPIRAF